MIWFSCPVELPGSSGPWAGSAVAGGPDDHHAWGPLPACSAPAMAW